ncbi:MAG TPA: PRC-barrel domain-containing protein [Anaerolineales bacterium]|nr:PRC-barrel domain-containing protein [Anaerolineales bacterium]
MKTEYRTPVALSSSTLTGDPVHNLAGETLGKLEEIMIDLESGRVAYVVLSFGGFLGMGDKLFAIPWEAITVDTDKKAIVLNVSKEVLENAPGFDKDHWPDTSEHAWLTDIYAYYGFDPYWR